MAERKSAVVLGVGPGLGQAAAKRFAVGGFDIAMMARDVDKLAPLKSDNGRRIGLRMAHRCPPTARQARRSSKVAAIAKATSGILTMSPSGSSTSRPIHARSLAQTVGRGALNQGEVRPPS